MEGLPRLRELSPALKLGLSGVLLTLAGGYAAAVAHMVHHHGQKDDEPGLSMDDLVGAYHGVDREAPLLTAVEGDHGTEYLPAPGERETLRKWLTGGRLSEDFDSLELGDNAPAEILSRRCLSCHARNAKEGGDIGERLPLEYWDDVERVAFSRHLDPVSVEILTVSTHTHALTLPLVVLAAAALFLLTRWPRPLRHGVFALAGVSTFLDLAGMWIARESAGAIWLILIAGAAYGLALGVALLGTLADLWLPSRRR